MLSVCILEFYILCGNGQVKIATKWCVIEMRKTNKAAISWTQGDTFCRLEGGSLITVETPEKWEAAWEVITAYGGHGKKRANCYPLKHYFLMHSCHVVHDYANVSVLTTPVITCYKIWQSKYSVRHCELQCYRNSLYT